MNVAKVSKTIPLSVVIPVFNGEGVIEEAINSAFKCGATEVIVVDDGSLDRSAEIAAGLGCIVIRQENLGAAEARRTGVKILTNAFVALLDADDRLNPSGITKSLELASQTSDWAAIGGLIIGESSLGGSCIMMPGNSEMTLTTLIRQGYSPLPPSGLIWRSEILKAAMFGSTPAVWPRYAEDYELLIRGSFMGRILFHSDITAFYQLEGGKSSFNPFNSISCAQEIREHYAKLLGISIRVRGKRAIRCLCLIRMAQVAKAKGNHKQRFSLLAKAFCFSPGEVLSLALAKAFQK